MQIYMLNLQAICRFWWYCCILSAICKICKIICTICKYVSHVFNTQNMHSPLSSCCKTYTWIQGLDTFIVYSSRPRFTVPHGVKSLCEMCRWELDFRRLLVFTPSGTVYTGAKNKLHLLSPGHGPIRRDGRSQRHPRYGGGLVTRIVGQW
jgi:hypothetical protein